MQKNRLRQRYSALVLGATGAFGAAITRQLSNSGWEVRAVTRGGQISSSNLNTATDSAADLIPVQWIKGSLDEPGSIDKAASGVDVIVHSVNVPYPKWNTLMVQYTEAVIELARRHNAQLYFVGNIYNAGIPDNGIITDVSQDSPINDKGQLRARLENLLKAASEDGIPTTIMRFGDFFGPGIETYNWFNECTKSLGKRKLTAPGHPDFAHSWTYLPDAAAAADQVLRQRIDEASSDNCIVLPFPGHVFSINELKLMAEEFVGDSIKLDKTPWPFLKLLGLVWPLIRDVVSMRYLWENDIRLSGEALTRYLGERPYQTKLKTAVRTTLLANDHKLLPTR